MTLRLLMIFFSSFLVMPASAQDYDNNFETTSEGIIQRLLPPEDESFQAPSPSSPSSAGWRNAFDDDGGMTVPPEKRPDGVSASDQEETIQNRHIKVLRRQGGKEVWTTIVSPTKRTGQYINIAVEFDVDSSSIRKASIPLLKELGKALSDPRLQHQTVYINGHTDSDGSQEHNLKLSFDRAESVKNFLVEHFSISSYRLQIQGYGEGMPIVPNTSPANKQLNRRVEIVAIQQPF